MRDEVDAAEAVVRLLGRGVAVEERVREREGRDAWRGRAERSDIAREEGREGGRVERGRATASLLQG